MPYLPNQSMMPNYFSGQYGYPNYQNASYAPQPTQPQPGMKTIDWVDGEVGAKAFQMPAGHPPNSPIALWDTNDQVIYLKSVNQMGMPNPLQKLRYTTEEQPSGFIQNGVSGNTQPAKKEESLYATKADLEQIREEMHKYLDRGDK